MMRRPALASLALVMVVALALGTATASAAEPVTVGQTLPGASLCATSWFVQTSPSSYAVPAGNWTIASWSTFAGDSTASGNAGGYMGLIVFRPTGSGAYEVVGESPVEALTASSLNTFTLAAPIPVQGGDLLGMYEDQADCGVLDAGGTVAGGLGPEPPVGAIVTTTWENASFQANISVTLAAAPPTTANGCKHGGWQSFGVFKNQGDCVSYFATGGKNLPAGGQARRPSERPAPA
jgi:hypothetical protein